MIILLTDFGSGSLYSGVMRAVIAAHAPRVPVLDITHEVPPQDVAFASFALVRALEYVPAGSVAVAVVDPGVGSDRRRIAAEIAGARVVCPDNGIVHDSMTRWGVDDAVELDRPALFLPSISATFEGRDVFGPIAARLATGAALSDVGSEIRNPHENLKRLNIAPVEAAGNWASGNIREIDSFGNVLTDIPRAVLARNAAHCELRIEDFESVRAPLARTYSDAAPGELCVLAGSFGFLELAVPCGSAALRFPGLKRLSRCRITVA